MHTEKQFKSQISKTDGKVSIYFPELMRSKRVMPIDARDHIKNGEAVLFEPRVNMNGPGGPIIVMHSKVKRQEQKGYTVTGAANPDAVNGDDIEDEDNDITSQTYDWDKHTIPQLRGFADAANLTIQSGANKNGIIEMLRASNFVPQSADVEE